MQGKKAAGRLDRLASIQSAVQTVLGVLGLGPGDPVKVLQNMRQLALHRYTCFLKAYLVLVCLCGMHKVEQLDEH